MPPRKDYHVNITRSIYHYAYARQTQVNWRKEKKKRREDKGNNRKEKKAKQEEKKKERKEERRQRKKSKKRLEKKRKKGKEKRTVIPADFKNWLIRGYEVHHQSRHKGENAK